MYKKLYILILLFILALLYSSISYANSIGLNLVFNEAGDDRYKTASYTIIDALTVTEDGYTANTIKVYANVFSEDLVDNDITLKLQLEGEERKVLIDKGNPVGQILLGEFNIPCKKNLTYFVDATLAGTPVDNYINNPYVYNIILSIAQ